MKLKPLIAFLAAIFLTILFSKPGLTHWADLSVAEIFIQTQSIEINLTFPTGMISFADTDRDGKISELEFRSNQAQLTQFIGAQIQLKDGNKIIDTLELSYQNQESKTNQLTAPTNTHSTFKLLYSSREKIKNPIINYKFFLPNVPTATCLATILSDGKGEQFIFSPTQTIYTKSGNIPKFFQQNLWLAVAGAFIWGGMHALSPGHGKTLVAAYLVGENATWIHALILGLTTTATHTIGVIIMGLLALFATQFFAPEAIFPWLSLLAGLGILGVGLHLLWGRRFSKNIHDHQHSHDHDHHHSHNHEHFHDHDHHHHDHIHTIDNSMPWQKLILLGIASGLTPCPAALVLLLGAISLQQIGLGISLVLCFSIGLSIVLSGLGILLVSAKKWFQKFPVSPKNQFILPIVSASLITIIGLISTATAIHNIIR